MPLSSEAEQLALAKAARLRAEAEAKPEPQAEPGKVGLVSGIADRLTQGFLFGGGDEYLAGLSAVVGLQPTGAGDAEFMQFEKPLKERYTIALDAIRAERDSFGEEHPVAGAVSEVTGAVAGSLLPIKYINTLGRGFQTASTTGRVGRIAGQSALGGSIYGGLSADGGVKERAIGAAGGGVVGGVSGPVAYGVMRGVMGGIRVASGPVVAKLERLGLKATDIDPKTGEFTERGLKLLRDKGLNPDDITADIRSYYATAARMATEGASAEDIARVADIESLGIKPTMGQATGEVLQQAEEAAMAAGARGRKPAEIMGEAIDVQKAQLTGATESLSPQVTGAPFKPTTMQDASDAVIEAIPRLADEARAAGRAAYEMMEKSGAMFRGEAFTNFADRVGAALKMTGVRIGPDTPQAAGALESIRQRFLGAKGGSVPFSSIEDARQVLNTYFGAARRTGGREEMAMRAVLKEFDNSVDGMFNSALIQGDDSALALAKEARGLWSKYLSTFGTKTGIDRQIWQLAKGEASPNEVASWFFGLSRHMGAGKTSRAMQRLKSVLGPTSDEFATLKQAAFNRLTEATQPKLTDRATAITTNITEFLDGKGRALSRIMFSDKERSALRLFSNKVGRLVTNPDALNRSGSGYENARAIASLADAAVAALGFKVGGVGGAVAAREGAKAFRAAKGSVLAKFLSEGPVKAPSRYIPIYTAPRVASRLAGGTGGNILANTFGGPR